MNKCMQVLDFTSVIGVDATAARSCFLMLTQLMKAARVTVVFTSMSEEVEALFRAHAVINAQTTVVIPYLDDALEWCEEEILLRYVL
jgi:SulP family sulfate permease